MNHYWSHYAQVMEFNRQRMALTSVMGFSQPSVFDIPAWKMADYFETPDHNSSPQPKEYFKKPTRIHNHKKPVHTKFSDDDTSEASTSTEVTADSAVASEIQSEEEESIEFVVDEGFMKFLEISMEHKLKRKLQKEADKHKELQREQRTKESNLMSVKRQKLQEHKSSLYGDKAESIMGLERMVDIHFNHSKDLNKPALWPNIPLNIKF